MYSSRLRCSLEDEERHGRRCKWACWCRRKSPNPLPRSQATRGCPLLWGGGRRWPGQQCHSDKFLDRESPTRSLRHRLTFKKVIQVLGLHRGGPGAGRNRPYTALELVVQVLFLQAHQRTCQVFGSCTLLHFSPPSGGRSAEGGDRRAWAVDSALGARELSRPVLPCPSICPIIHPSVCPTSQPWTRTE